MNIYDIKQNTDWGDYSIFVDYNEINDMYVICLCSCNCVLQNKNSATVSKPIPIPQSNVSQTNYEFDKYT